MNNNKRISKWLLPLFILVIVCGNALAIPPQTISYQAYLKNNIGLPVNAIENVTFRLYSVETGGTDIWSDTLSVTITDGLFSVELGTVGNPLPKASMDNPIWLGVEINIDGEAVPRKALNSVNNAFHAESVEVPLNLIGSSTDTMTVTNSSTSSNVTGVHGLISSTAPGGWSAAVRGENKGTGGSGIGVHGSQDGSGWGVYGTATSGRGVYGQSNSGNAVYGASTTGTAAYFSSSSGYGLIVQSGNVGVGILTPGSKLTVAGTVQSTSGGFKFPDGSIQTSASAGAGDIAAHAADSSAHHVRYEDSDAVSAIKLADGAGSTLDADLVDGLHASEIIAAAAYTDSEAVAAIKAADGSGSLLDADLLDGRSSEGFLKSDGSDNFTSGTFEFNPGTTLKLSGTTKIGAFSFFDDDTLFFDDGTSQYLRWTEATDRFEFSNDLHLNGGTLKVGPTGGNTFTYNMMRNSTADTPTSGAIGSQGDLYVGSDLEVGSTAYLGLERVVSTSAEISTASESCVVIDTIVDCYIGEATASCPVAKAVISGGCRCTNSTFVGRCVVTSSYPGTGESWSCEAAAASLAFGFYQLEAYAMCARVGN